LRVLKCHIKENAKEHAVMRSIVGEMHCW